MQQRLQPNICTVAPSNSLTIFSDKPKHPLASSGRPFLAAAFSLEQMLYRLYSLVGEDLNRLSLKGGTGGKRTSLTTGAEICYHYLCEILKKKSKKSEREHPSLQDVCLSNHRYYDHASCLFLRSSKRKKGEVGWGWEKVRTKWKPNVYTVQFSYQKTTEIRNGFDGTAV
jgi:hypothetical protein